MIWKPKEKELTKEEAVALAKKELAHLWIGSVPLIAGVRTAKGVFAHPLDPSVEKGVWVAAFVDPTSFAGHNLIQAMVAWHKRYARHGARFLFVFRFPYQQAIYSQRAVEEFFMKARQVEFPVAVDADGLLSAAFGANSEKDFPRVVVFNKSKVLLAQSQRIQSLEVETKIQQFLRQEDTGLAMFPPLSDVEGLPEDLGGLEFGKAKGKNIKILAQIPEDIPPDTVCAVGKWEQDAEKMVTSDPTAAIGFRATGPEVALVAWPIFAKNQIASLKVEVNGLPVFEDFIGPSLQSDDEGVTVMKVVPYWFFHLTSRLPEKSRNIVIRFFEAHRVKMSVFGARFGERGKPQ